MATWTSVVAKAYFDFVGRSLAVGALIVAAVKLDSVPLYTIAGVGGLVLLAWVSSAAGHLGDWGGKLRDRKQLSMGMTWLLGSLVIGGGASFCGVVTWGMFEIINTVLAIR